MENTRFVAADMNTNVSGKEVSEQANASRGATSQYKWLTMSQEQ